MGDIVYLTGSTGFIGDVIVRQCETNNAISKVYCPIRDKNDVKGMKRFQTQFGSCKKTAFLHPSDPLPDDVTLVVLNGYCVKFFNDVDAILEQNVSPMLQILDQCQAAGNRIRGISIVSTAYVQEPLPFKRDPLNRIEFVLKDHTTALQLYQDLVTKKTTNWKELQAKLNETGKVSDHLMLNNYAFSKHIMEHLIHELYSNLPVCIVRPSIVAHSRDGTFGHGLKTGFPLFLSIAKKPVLRFPRNEGKLNLVFVDFVAKEIIRGASEVAAPAVAAKENGGTKFHPILSCTSGCELTSIKMFEIAAPSVWRFHIPHSGIRSFLRSMELLFVYFIADAKKARLLGLVYQNFDHIMGATWDFEERFELTTTEYAESVDNYHAKANGDNNSRGDERHFFAEWLSVTIFMIMFIVGLFNPNDILSLTIRTVVLFVSLRMLALLTMQSLFYGETHLRKNLKTTIRDREYDLDQHEREKEIWPSVLFSGLELYFLFRIGLLPDPSTMPLISVKSITCMLLAHALPVEFLYYWAHRLMHADPRIYQVHKHHHLSIVPTPKTSVTFLWTEHLFYDLLFALPLLIPAFLGCASQAVMVLYIPLFDIVNSLGHTNLEMFPSWYLDSPMFPFFYCSSYHGVHHHSNPNANFALFMPMYDMLFNTYSEKQTRKNFFFAQSGSVHQEREGQRQPQAPPKTMA